MTSAREPFDLGRLRVLPLARRRSLVAVEDVLIDPERTPGECHPALAGMIRQCAGRIRAARSRGADVVLIFGAHLVRNGAALVLGRLMAGGWLTHLATNGAGAIHDWEHAWLGRSTEDVAENLAAGTFGTWDETGRYTHLALLAGGLDGAGYGQALGRFIAGEGVDLPAPAELEGRLRREPVHPAAPAWADLLAAMAAHGLGGGRYAVTHRWKHASVLCQAWRHGVPLTVHPGIGYDIISNHPMFNGAAIGRAAGVDFRRFAAAVEGLDGGVVLSVGSAVMGPQVFEKSLSCVNNVRLQAGRPVVNDHSIYVVDLHDGGGWDWGRGEPPRTHPAYYLRFCKSYSRAGGELHYLQCDNALFLHWLCRELGDR